jgi:hypothetical protein
MAPVTHRIEHSESYASAIVLPVLPAAIASQADVASTIGRTDTAPVA